MGFQAGQTIGFCGDAFKNNDCKAFEADQQAALKSNGSKMIIEVTHCDWPKESKKSERISELRSELDSIK